MAVANYDDYPAAYRQYNTQYPRQEVLGWVLYDTVTYASAASVSLTLFNAVRATLDLSNMEVAGQLAAPKAFLIRGIGFNVKQLPRKEARAASGSVQPGAIDNIAQLVNTGVAQLNIGAKNYGQWPLYRLPSSGGVFGMGAMEGEKADPGDVVDWATNGYPDPCNVYTLTKPLFIAPQINFSMLLTWPAAITLSGGSTAIQILLQGDLLRPVQ